MEMLVTRWWPFNAPVNPDAVTARNHQEVVSDMVEVLGEGNVGTDFRLLLEEEPPTAGIRRKKAEAFRKVFECVGDSMRALQFLKASDDGNG